MAETMLNNVHNGEQEITTFRNDRMAVRNNTTLRNIPVT